MSKKMCAENATFDTKLKSNTEMFEEKLNIKEIRKNKTRIIIFYHLSIR